MSEMYPSYSNDTRTRILSLLKAKLKLAGDISLEDDERADLVAQIEGQTFVFRIKLFPEKATQDFLMEGMSELYEFCYLQNLPAAKPVLVIEQLLPIGLSWLQQFLEDDRKIRLLWNGDDEFHASPQTREELSFLW